MADPQGATFIASKFVPENKDLGHTDAAVGGGYGEDRRRPPAPTGPCSGVSYGDAGLEVGRGNSSSRAVLLHGGRLFAVQNFLNQIAEVRLSPDLTSGAVENVVTSELFRVPTTVARFGDCLAPVNAKFESSLAFALAPRRP